MESRLEHVRRIVTVVYVALLASVGACAVVLRFLPVHAGRGPRPAMEWGLLATGIGEYAAATLLGRRMLTARSGNSLARTRSYFLIRFAAAEATAVFGMAVFLMGSPPVHAAAFFAVSILMFLVSFPGKRAFSEAASLRGGAG